jgi:hypothetical protein
MIAINFPWQEMTQFNDVECLKLEYFSLSLSILISCGWKWVVFIGHAIENKLVTWPDNISS